jgi:hypothetical protein
LESHLASCTLHHPLVIIALRSSGLPSGWPRDPQKATSDIVQPRLTEALPPLNTTTGTTLSRRRSPWSHTSLNNAPANCPSSRFPALRLNYPNTRNYHHHHQSPSSITITWVSHTLPQGNIMTPSRAESRVTMSNQPPPDLTHRMPPKKCLFRWPARTPVTLGTSRLCWKLPSQSIAGNRAFALSAQRYLKNIFGMSFIK